MDKAKLKVLVVTQYFWPENMRINDLVSDFVGRGHEVTVLTGCPNYPEGLFRFQREPGQLFLLSWRFGDQSSHAPTRAA